MDQVLRSQPNRLHVNVTIHNPSETDPGFQLQTSKVRINGTIHDLLSGVTGSGPTGPTGGKVLQVCKENKEPLVLLVAMDYRVIRDRLVQQVCQILAMKHRVTMVLSSDPTMVHHLDQ